MGDELSLLLEIFNKIEKAGGPATLCVATGGGKTKVKLEITTTPAPPTSSVNRVLFTSSNNSEETTATTSDDLNNPDDFDGVEPIKSNSCKSNELSEEEEKALLPTVSENDVEKSPTDGLKPPSEPGLKKVASAAKMELTGVPVVENDPLGALSNSTSPTSSMPKSATANSKSKFKSYNTI